MSNASTIQGLLATNDDLALKIEQLKKKAKDVGKLTFNEYTIAIGDLESFKIDKLERANLFIIKPVVAGATTNLTVETQRNIYFLQVTEGGKGNPNYSLKFTVPASTSSR